MRCVNVSASDDRMDCREMFYDPINPLPKKCPKCSFPDLDHIPQPYYLIKSRTMTPNELALAENGNFLIRERVRRGFELLLPGGCTYFPTSFKGTNQQTPWLLAVPNYQVDTARVDPSIARCDACNEPRSAHPGTQWTESLLRSESTQGGWTCELEQDIVKSATWGSSEIGWNRWISRDLYISVRLLHLLKKIRAKGFYEATCEKPNLPNKAERLWIKEKVHALVAAGISLHADGTLSSEDAKWLREYISTHSSGVEAHFDVKAIERRVGARLPKSYTYFVRAVGPILFEGVDAQEGFEVSLIPPDELGAQDLSLECEDGDSRAVNAVTFATTCHGDAFCFDAQKSRKEHAVFLYKHEYNLLEPYADNFASCIKRFVGGSDM